MLIDEAVIVVFADCLIPFWPPKAVLEFKATVPLWVMFPPNRMNPEVAFAVRFPVPVTDLIM